MPERRRHEPRLSARDAIFRCGYGPRAIRLARDCRALFVGCKDGSVTMVRFMAADSEAREVRLCGAGPTGIRSLCDLNNGWLLLGQDDGRASVLPWKKVTSDESQHTPVLLDLPHPVEEVGAVGYVGRWEGETFIVSPRRADALLLRLAKTADGIEFRLIPSATLPGVKAMSGFGHLKVHNQEERWIVCKTGSLWWHGPDGLERQDDVWNLFGFERPGFVFDLAVVRTNPENWPDHGIYLSTDEGVFLLRPPAPGDPPRENGQPLRFGLESVYLPGITETCMAIAHAVQGDHCFLWLSDFEGSVHLFWSDFKFWEHEAHGRRSGWKRSGLLERRFPVMRALASWSPGKEQEAIVCQACRDDRVVVSRYVSQETAETASPRTRERRSDERDDAAELLSWGDVKRLRARLPAGDLWSLEARVADHIEEIGRDSEWLRRFLRNPGPDLAGSVLTEIVLSSAERAGQALTLWTHTLIGTVHRRLENPGIRDYLGIIRWLRRIGESERFCRLVEKHPDAAELLRSTLDRNIQYARKWGVFGRTYANRSSALSALKPLQDQAAEERQFDHLVYESLLFRRQVDLMEALPDPAPHAFAPWDLRYLHLVEEASGEHDEYVAVSWRDGATVYRRSGAEWENLTGGKGSALEPDLGGRILLGVWRSGGKERPFLVSSPVPEEGKRSSQPAQIQLRFLDDLRGKPAASLPVAQLLNQSDPARPESVYCLHALGESNRVVVGLEGTSGVARIGLLEVTSVGALQPLCQTTGTALPVNHPESKALLRNPVWALTSYNCSAEGAVVLAGCNDGQIWKLRLRFEASSDVQIERRLVGRLGAPVTALSCRAGAGKDGELLRVFAGGADGTLVAFQALGSWHGDDETYTTLWATQEQGPVRGLHALQSPLVVNPEGPERENVEAQHLVLAVIQTGMAVLILDRPAVELHSLDALRRLGVPGERLGRFSLRSMAFSSVLLPNTEGPLPSLARLLVAPSTEGPRLVTLHYPKFTPLRRSKFQDLQKRWLASMHGSSDRVQGYLLRRPETTYAAASYLPAILVRWILPYNQDKRWQEYLGTEGPDRGPAEQWLPRHLRPLAGLEAAWKKGEPLGHLLQEALFAAHEIGDKVLFKEILEAALSRANHQLYQEAASDRGIPFAEHFEALLTKLDKVKGIWEGSSGSLDSRMRITIAKNLLDGDTLWSLAKLSGASRDGDSATSALQAEAALAASIRLVHRSLGKGDLLLALETLRATNLALLRLCRRLQRCRNEDWSQAQAGQQFVPWEILRGLFQAVGDFAARVAHPKGNLGEVVAHEVCRAYALGMVVCPPAIAELAIWIAEADLPIETSQRVVQQLDLLEILLSPELPPLSRDLKKLLEISFGMRTGGSYKDVLFFPSSTGVLPWITDGRFIGGVATVHERGKLEAILGPNVDTLLARKPFDEIVVWLHGLARNLTDDAGDVDLQKYKEQLGAIAIDPSEKDQFRHSRQFWSQALKDLQARCDLFQDLFVSPGEPREVGGGLPLRPVRPELVLFSSTLHDWCKDQRQQLNSLSKEYQIFEPASSLYDETLALVEQAASRFRRGAAVQKNLVLGVLGHGLLELLDEHLLEVWEVAQALDPLRTWEQDQLKEGDRYSRSRGESTKAPTSTAARFANYLLQRALKAEVISKNLRSLQGLLGFTGGGTDPSLTLNNLLTEHDKRWRLPLKTQDESLRHSLDSPLNRRTYHFLRLTLDELLQNDHMHGVPGDEEQTKPVVKAIWSPSRELTLSFEFHYPADDKAAAQRARDLADQRLQTMMPPREEPHLPSHGTGLYLANLAAGAVGWKLEPQACTQNGVLRFELIRKNVEER
jgi:hypothetical protein